MTSIRFTVPGRPVPKQRAKVVGGPSPHGYYPARTPGSKLLSYPEYREWVTYCYIATVKESGQPLRAPDEQGYALTVHVWVSNIHHGDIEGIAGSVADALEGYVWLNDAQVARGHQERHPLADGEKPRIEVEITPLGGRGFVAREVDP